MTKNKAIGFALSGIKTEQFAILEDSFSEKEDMGLRSELEFMYIPEDKMIGCFAMFVFEQEKKTIVKIEVGCHFQIEEKSWEDALDKARNVLVFPRKFMTHLATITVGTTRGVLFAKTEGTKVNELILPFVNVDEMINADVEFALENA